MLNVQALRASYGESEILHSLDLNVQPGEIVAIMGRNGMGKTTLMKVISGLRFADRGRVSVLGYDPAKRPVELLKQLYYLPAEP
ncbi:MAG: ATP-binding cassette domain-containing protein, partial [Pseudomonadota bacterium]